MKKIVTIVLLMLIIISTSTLFFGCAHLKDVTPNDVDLAKNATYTFDSKEHDKMSFSSKTGKTVEVKFDGEKAINTIVLKESGFNVTEFRIYNGDDLLYQQDEIGDQRYCFIKEVTTSSLKIEFVSSNGKYKITDFEAYYKNREQSDFRVTAYVIADRFSPTEYTESFAHCTDFILFSAATFNEKGELSVNNEILEPVRDYIKSVKSGSNYNIYVNLLLSTDTYDSAYVEEHKADLHTQAMKDNKEKFISNIMALVNDGGYDGISFDYEYPYTRSAWKVFSNFLVDMKASLNDKKLVIAVGPWGLQLSNKAKDAVDVFEVMSYDLIDERGNHSGWQHNCIEVIDYMISKGYELKKVDLGLAFYSRPIDCAAYWGDYKSEYEKLGKFGNYVAEEFDTTTWDGDIHVKGRWYNGVNIIRDKVAFAYDAGVGGVMMWHYYCDVEYSSDYSLMRAINSVFDPSLIG